MSALGYYPSIWDIDNMTRELVTGRASLDDVFRLFGNHKPVKELMSDDEFIRASLDDISKALESLTRKTYRSGLVGHSEALESAAHARSLLDSLSS
jgi:hypothetical protein